MRVKNEREMMEREAMRGEKMKGCLLREGREVDVQRLQPDVNNTITLSFTCAAPDLWQTRPTHTVSGAFCQKQVVG